MNSKLLLLDGATGTELNRRGVDTGLPLWSANALTTDAGLNVLRQVHLDYLNAGADIITTNTFRTNRRVLAGKGFSAHELTLRAVTPLLWAYRHENNFQFELSVAPCELPSQLRQCQEDSLLYLHRIEYGHSTLCNHGRRHPLWTRAFALCRE